MTHFTADELSQLVDYLSVAQMALHDAAKDADKRRALLLADRMRLHAGRAADLRERTIKLRAAVTR